MQTLNSRNNGVRSTVPIVRLKRQFDLSALLAMPFLVYPFFIGGSLPGELNADAATVVDWFSLLLHRIVALTLYVIVFCLMTTRRFDRRSDFRKFPFRGSMLIGGLAGASFMVQLVLGFFAAIAWSASLKLLDLSELLFFFASVLGSLIHSTAMGAFVGAWFGLVAGSAYCIARKIKELRTGKSTIRPGQAIKRMR